MRFVIFSPLTVASAIGRVTALVTAALREAGHEAVIVRSEAEPILRTPARSVSARILHWTDRDLVRDAIQVADVVVYQIGDSYQFHRGCLEWLPIAPGVVCLHDYFLGSLFRAWAKANDRHAQAILRAWYGDTVAEKYFTFGDPAWFVENTAQTAPMTEWITSMARGVLTHSSWGIDRVLASCAGPVQVAALPYDAPSMLPETSEPATERRFTLLTIGHMNANKRIASVVRAIASNERLRSLATYRLVGEIETEMRSRIEAESRRLGVTVSIEGQVSDQMLRLAIEESDVVCCLRFPALEAASASAIEAMLYGKAVVVMNTGFYEELPDECVAKVSPDREIGDLEHVLAVLESDRDGRRALGERAAAWAARTFRADAYARSLVDLCERFAVTASILDATSYYAASLARWGGVSLITAPDLVDPLRILESARRRSS